MITDDTKTKRVVDFLLKEVSIMLNVFTLIQSKGENIRDQVPASFALLNKIDGVLKERVENVLKIDSTNISLVYEKLFFSKTSVYNSIILTNSKLNAIMKKGIKLNITKIFEDDGGLNDVKFNAEKINRMFGDNSKGLRSDLFGYNQMLKELNELKIDIDDYVTENNLTNAKMKSILANSISNVNNILLLNISNDLLSEDLEDRFSSILLLFDQIVSKIIANRHQSILSITSTIIESLNNTSDVIESFLLRNHINETWFITDQIDNSLLDMYTIIKVSNLEVNKYIVSFVKNPIITLSSKNSVLKQLMPSCRNSFLDFDIRISTGYSKPKTITNVGDIYNIIDALCRYKINI